MIHRRGAREGAGVRFRPTFNAHDWECIGAHAGCRFCCWSSLVVVDVTNTALMWNLILIFLCITPAECSI
jgi:hypothetical protein